jgi:hypothetical protein
VQLPTAWWWFNSSLTDSFRRDFSLKNSHQQNSLPPLAEETHVDLAGVKTLVIPDEWRILRDTSQNQSQKSPSKRKPAI